MYIYGHRCAYTHIYIYIYMKGFAPCRRPLNSGFDDTTIRCFDGLLTAGHLSPIGGSRACLLRSILAPGDGLGPHVGGPWRCQGLGLGPGLARGRQNGLDCTPVRAGALFYWGPGIEMTAKVEGDLNVLGPTINLTTA